MVSLAGNEEQFLVSIEGVSAPLHVVRFTVREGISQLFAIEVEISSPDLDIPLDKSIGQAAALTVEGKEAARYFNGIVARFEQVGNTQRYTIYRVLIVPWVWRLQFRRDVRIFQEMSTKDIVQEVLQGAGLAADAFKFSLDGSYETREYCVQYRESDWDFICRLLEEEGIFYLFEHSEDDHLLVFADGAGAHEPIDGTPEIAYRPASGMQAEAEVVTNWASSRQLRTGKVTLRDFYFEDPALDLEKEKGASADDDLEHYDYPGRYADPTLGGQRAKVRLEEYQTFIETGRGSSSVNRFVPGALFTHEDHPATEANAEWMLVRVEHEGHQPLALGEDADPDAIGMYGNRFTVIPSDQPFRPPRVTPKPTVRGVQTAIVVGPSGEEIYVDKHGRVKVQFHWDRIGKKDENSSCWIRVSQLWAGQGWGAMWIPRIGHEVIVDFVEGDPDRPIITGRVYHGTNTPPYDLPAEKTKSTIKSESSKGGGGYNELRFEDLKGKEEVYLHGQKDWTILIENDKNQQVGHDETLQVGNDRTKTIGHDQTQTIGNDKTETVGNNKSTTVAKHQTLTIGLTSTETVGANKAESIGGAKELTIGGAYAVTVGAAMAETVGGTQSVSVGKTKTEEIGEDLTVKSGKNIVIEAKESITLKAGKASITLKKNGDITIDAGGKLVVQSKKDSTVKASGNLVLKGKKITEN